MKRLAVVLINEVRGNGLDASIDRHEINLSFREVPQEILDRRREQHRKAQARYRELNRVVLRAKSWEDR